jgi:hypothetical protein
MNFSLQFKAQNEDIYSAAWITADGAMTAGILSALANERIVA